MSGTKHDAGKLPLELLPVDALEAVAGVLKFGAQKYAKNNWRGGISYSRLYGSTLRHIFSWWRGENTDPETGLHPLAHACCGLLFLLSYELHAKPGLDDREENNA
jgi:hypothetical protein